MSTLTDFMLFSLNATSLLTVNVLVKLIFFVAAFKTV